MIANERCGAFKYIGQIMRDTFAIFVLVACKISLFIIVADFEKFSCYCKD